MKVICLPLGMVERIVNLLSDIAKMKPGFEVYETAVQLTKDLQTHLEAELQKK